MPEKIRFAQLSFRFSHARPICNTAKKHPNMENALQ